MLCAYIGNSVDSPNSCRAHIDKLHRDWLRRAGALVSDDGMWYSNYCYYFIILSFIDDG